jgi:hypothetical protein
MYLDNCGTKYLRNHSSRNDGGTSTFIKLFWCLHSRMWSEIWSTFVCSKLVRILLPMSYLTSNWKWFKKTIANSPKVEYLERSISMYHFTSLPMRVHWNQWNWMELSLNELAEHHKCKVVTWSPRSSLGLASKFGMSEGNLVGIGGQHRSW